MRDLIKQTALTLLHLPLVPILLLLWVVLLAFAFCAFLVGVGRKKVFPRIARGT